MNNLEFPYSPENKVFLVMMTPILIVCGAVLVATGAIFGYIVGRGFLSLSILAVRNLLITPHHVVIDLASGVASFIPARWGKKRIRPDVHLPEYSCVMAASRRPAGSYYVVISNHKGEESTLLSCVDRATASEACTQLHEHFGLINRGFV